MVWDEGTHVVGVSGIEISGVDSPMVSVVLVFAGGGMMTSVIIALVTVPVIAISVSIAFSFSLSIHIAVISSPFRLFQALLGSVIFCVILNFSALFGFSRFASILSLSLLLVSSGHVPLGDWLAEPL